MNEKIIKQALAKLKYTYPNAFKDYTTEDVQFMIKMWSNDFKDDDPKVFETAVERLRMKSKYCPSIAEIKQEIALISNPTLQLKPDEEWENVRKAIRKYGFYRGDEAMKSLNPTTAATVRMLGGWENICQSTDGDWLRKNFMDLFSTKVENYEEVALLSEPQLTLSEITRLAKIKEIEALETNDKLLIENASNSK